MRRLRGQFEYVTAVLRSTIENVSAEEVGAFMELARGTSDYDLRVWALCLLARGVENPALLVGSQPGSPGLRRVLETVFWATKRKMEYERSRDFLRGITQEKIIEIETNGAPFYRAYREIYAGRDEAGVFVESDEEVVHILQELSPAGPVRRTSSFQPR